MRLWSLHPKYLDSRGLVALWREALLAQAVLRGKTRGYQHHPQLNRFRAQMAPVSAVATYLLAVHREAVGREYLFDNSKIGAVRKAISIPVTAGQIEYEWSHLLAKLAERDPVRYETIRSLKAIECHPMFWRIAGGVESWERR